LPLITRFVARRLVDADAMGEIVSALEPMHAVRTPLLEGLLSGLEGRSDVARPAEWASVASTLLRDRQVRPLVEQVTQSFSDAESARMMLETLLQAGADIEVRRAALRRLARDQRPSLRELLPQLLGDSDLRLEAIRAIASFDDAALGERLLQMYDMLAMNERDAVIQVLASRPRYGWMLTEAIELGAVPREEIPPHVARQLRRVVGSGFVEVWGPIDQIASDKEALEARYRALLTPEAVRQASVEGGQQVFVSACGMCHQMYGEGGMVGPDLTGSNRTSLDYILSNIIRPGEEMQEDYRMVIVTMRDGRTHIGSIAAETDRAITVQPVGQPARVLSRGDIQSVEVSNMSLMPEGLFAPLSDEDILNLVAYLQRAGPA